MKPVVLVGSELEENLSLRYLAAMVEAHGFDARIIPMSDATQVESVARQVAALDPLVIGLSVPFQLFALPTLSLGESVRRAGCDAHISAGGHFVTFEFEHVLQDFPSIDSVVRHEGEIPFLSLCENLRDGKPTAGIPAVVYREGRKVGGGDKHPLPPLDTLPFPDRRGVPHEVLGVRTSPIVGSRGCYADCSFYCIHADARNANGARYRARSPENIVAEMKREHEERGVRLFLFHDDNFFVPSVEKNMTRYSEMKSLLDDEGLDEIGIVIKCHPNDANAELFGLLKSMGLIRVYVGIESNSADGLVSLNRRISSDDNERALRVLRELEIYHTFNLLLFDPEATLGGIDENLDFLERYADVPFNFCRAEVYAGTPLKETLERQGRLDGNYLAWSYLIRDPRVEVLFRIATTAFHTRNFKPDGIATINMGLRFDAELARHFYHECWTDELNDEVVELSRAVGESSVSLMREALTFIRAIDPYENDRVKGFTIDLARRVARSDLEFLKHCKELQAMIADRTESATMRSMASCR